MLEGVVIVTWFLLACYLFFSMVEATTRLRHRLFFVGFLVVLTLGIGALIEYEKTVTPQAYCLKESDK